MRRLIVALFASAALLALPASVSAQSCVAPPGTAAVDEYCENVPNAGGNGGSGSGSGGSGSNGSAAPAVIPVPAGTAEELEDAGDDGEALAQALGEDGQGGSGSGQSGGGASGGSDAPSGSGSVTGVAPPAPGANPLSAVKQSVTDGATTGVAFGAALLVLTIGMGAWGWLAYRRRTQ